MAKKDKKGRVIFLSDKDNLLLKRHFLNLKEIGVTKSAEQVTNEIFVDGLKNAVKQLENGR